MKVPRIIQTFTGTSFQFVIPLALKIREKREAECESVKKEKDFFVLNCKVAAWCNDENNRKMTNMKVGKKT